MSDYLWDKSGEPDAEVERLEALLGGLAHRPGRLELPAAPAADARARRAPLLRYAAAAAVLLAALAGAFVAPRLGGRKEAGPVAASAPAPAPAPRTSPTLSAVPRPLEAQGAPAPREGRGGGLAGQPRRPPRRVAAAPRTTRGGVAVAAREPAGDGRRLRAKEQLVYALRLTGVKLEEVRRKVQGGEGVGDAAEGRSRTR